MNEDNRFLLLSFFLSFILLSDVNQCFIKVFRETMKELGLKEPTPKKYFNAFLLDEGKRREEASRMAYNTQFTSYMKEMLKNTETKIPCTRNYVPSDMRI